MSRPKQLVDRQHQLIHDRALDGLVDLYAPDGVYAMGPMRLKPAELPVVVGAYLAAFPDLHNEVTAFFECGDTVVVEQIVTGTHSGTFMTPFGPLPATGKRIRQEAVEIVRIRDGKIASWHSYVDQLATMLDLGVVVPGMRVG